MSKVPLPVLERETPPCQAGCPAGIDVARYIGLVALGRFSDAVAVVRERIPFPSVCGYICYRPCEPVCRRALWEAPVAINAIKDAAARRDDGSWLPRWRAAVARPSGRRVAVVGSGPAGLTAAYYLARRGGHEVTVFEAAPRPGGQLRIGVPPNRLPRDVVDREIALVTETRVAIRCETEVQSLDELFVEGYEAVFLAMGTTVPRRLGVPGEELDGVHTGVAFLRAANLGVETGMAPRVGPRVAVIGAGNVAVDCARTALRLGADDVRVYYRRSRREMPAYDFEMRAAENEGARLELLTAPTRIARGAEGLELTLVSMRLGAPDASRRARPEPVPGTERTVTVDTVLVAVGQKPSVSAGWGLALGPDGTLAVDPVTLETSRPGVFAGGDVVLGPRNIIEAIAHGRRAAIQIDRFLGGTGDIEETLAPAPAEEMRYAEIHPYGKPCVPVRELARDRRRAGFDPVLLGYDEAEAVDEARRCVRCDLWTLRGVPEAWWRRRGLVPYWLGGEDRRSRERDRPRTVAYGPYRIRYTHAPIVPDEYVPADEG